MNSSGLFCSRCGATNDVQAAFCGKCGTPLQPGSAVSTPVFAEPPSPGAPSGQFGPGTAVAQAYATQTYPVAALPVSYGGFWIRLLAYIIDGALISLVTLPLFFIIFGMGVAGANSRDPQVAGMAILAMFPMLMIITLAGGWLYFALMESSAKQGTLGKMLLKLKVADLNGNRIGFGRATGRYFAKWINSFTFLIGWIIAGFTARKQALHDFIAGTVVLKTNF